MSFLESWETGHERLYVTTTQNYKADLGLAENVACWYYAIKCLSWLIAVRAAGLYSSCPGCLNPHGKWS